MNDPLEDLDVVEERGEIARIISISMQEGMDQV